jgi:beta-lactamase regulating signal transducer with metallopeptidase domain
MMIDDLILTLLRTNLAASAGIVVVLAARGPARAWFGAHVGYALWLVVPVAAAAALLPGPVRIPGPNPSLPAKDWLSSGGHGRAVFTIWMLGALASTALGVWSQLRFSAVERAGLAGPAVVGVIQPRIVAPRGFRERFTDAERRLIRTHELAHIERGDPGWNAFATLATWVCWFNPLGHVALRAMRFDQELACDATVLGGRPDLRRAYADTLLKALPASVAAPFANHWRGARHPLEARIRALLADRPADSRQDVGVAALSALVVAAFAVSWAVQPAAAAPAAGSAEPSERVILIELQPADPSLSAWAFGPASRRADGGHRGWRP